ncbi:MAG: branched-chain amino acid ABC transporter permease [Candidatus Promineifilaceae bacterium]|nr:branched-chain amino acid ABC transporter permease [Candidatus Promineifilaceae bacterium]
MQTTIQPMKDRAGLGSWLQANAPLLGAFIALLALPFVVAILDGQPIGDMLASQTGSAKFVQGLFIEIFILAIYAISYDLILGVTGLLSFGHAMFFAAGAYGTGIALKNLELGIAGTLLVAVVLVGIVQALLFAVVLPRVKGITFALVTLGLASVFHIIVQSNELSEFTGADVGLQGVISPDFLNTNTERFRLYLIALLLTFAIYFIYRRFVDSPTGRVATAIRENEDRALMLGYNTFYFKLVVLLVASLTAALAGFLHTIHQPIVSPNVASLGWTVVALLIILIGGVGTLTGALVGAGVFRLLEFFLDRWFGESASFLLGAVYVALVLFVPYGIVGTWRVRALEIRSGRQRLLRLLGLGEPEREAEPAEEG